MSFVDTWDSPFATWDSGLQWDVNVGPSPGDVAQFINLITSEHRDKPKFLAMMTALTKPFADMMLLLLSIPGKFDLDVAVGVQLDAVGEWVGQSRELTIPLTGVYFAFDTAGVGFDQGSWYGPFNPITGIVALPDDAYRTLLRAKIASNSWNGTIPDAYRVWDTLFAGTGFSILIQDLGGMHMLFALIGNAPDAITLALLTNGYLSLKPAGVKVDAYVIPSVPNSPLFGFDVQNANIAGFDTGVWGTLLAAA